MNQELSSKASGNVLIFFLSLGLILSFVSLLLMLPYTFMEDFYFDYLVTIDDFISLFNTILYYLTVIVFLVWIYSVHRDINGFFKLYPISPGASLIYLIVPFISLFGLWFTFSAMGRFIKQNVSEAANYGRWISYIVPLFYCSHFGCSLASRYFDGHPEEITETVQFLLLGSDVLLAVIYLLMTVWIIKALHIAKQQLENVDAVIEPGSEVTAAGT